MTIQIKVGDWVKFKWWKNGQEMIAEVDSRTPLGNLATCYGLLREETVIEIRPPQEGA